MLEYLHLKNVGPAPEMELDLAPRLNLITGDNGLGKSFLLDIAWWALTRRWPWMVNPMLTSGRMARPSGPGEATIEFRFDSKVTKGSYTSTFVRQDQAWTGRAGRPANPGLVLYAQVDGSFAVWDPARNYWKRKGQVDVQDRPPAYVFSPQEVWDGLPLEPGPKLCNGLIGDWAKWQAGKTKSFALLASVLAELSPGGREKLDPGEPTRISLDDVRDIPTLRMPYGQDVAVLQASAAMRRIVALAYLLVWCWQEHVRASKLLDQATTQQVIFLIDEIEAHLHPQWQRTITKALLNVVQALAPDATVQLVTSTHSPLVMASLEPWFDPERDAWFDLDLLPTNGSSAVHLERRPFVRHGDVSNWLTSDAFDLRSARSIPAETAIQAARTLLRRAGEPSADQVRSVDQQLRDARLPDIDPFWVRWEAFAEPYLEARQ